MKRKESPILITVAQISLYLIKLLAVWIFLRGHNAPGGGFIAGLVLAGAIALQGLAYGWKHAQRILPFPYTAIMATGVLLAFGSGLAGPVLGQPFLEHWFTHVQVPLIGDVELATASIFDLGVLLVVVGAMKAVLLTISAEKSAGWTNPGEAQTRR